MRAEQCDLFRARNFDTPAGFQPAVKSFERGSYNYELNQA